MIKFNEEEYTLPATGLHMPLDKPICQSDYPLDWYAENFKPYAEEYLALPDRTFKTVVNWMERYIKPAKDYFGESLLLLAHYYMGGEIVKLVEYFGGEVGDSYQLALKAAKNPQKKVIIESAVHFMAESIAILARADQRVYITNPKAGCTMEMYAKDFMVEPAFLQLNARYGAETIVPVCYMNTSGRVKALTGAQNGAVCTSSNVKKIVQWALAQNKKILFIPDRHMGENVADWVGISQKDIAYWPGGTAGAQFDLLSESPAVIAQFDRAQLILFCSECSVHTFYQPAMVDYWRAKDYTIVVHPECRRSVVSIVDYCGSTAQIWDYVYHDRAGTGHYAIGTENHMVDNLKMACAAKGIAVVSLGDAHINGVQSAGCGCATMSRNDPPHLVAVLDLLRLGKIPEYNLVRPGDVVNEFTGTRRRLDEQGQAWLVQNAKIALENMIKITES